MVFILATIILPGLMSIHGSKRDCKYIFSFSWEDNLELINANPILIESLCFLCVISCLTAFGQAFTTSISIWSCFYIRFILFVGTILICCSAVQYIKELREEV